MKLSPRAIKIRFGSLHALLIDPFAAFLREADGTVEQEPDLLSSG